MSQMRLNVLFVCSRNQWRSPPAEAIYRDDVRLNVRSRGTKRNAVQTISTLDVAWADVILVMEQKHRNRILADFPDAGRFKPIHVLDMPDDYRFMDPELVELLQTACDAIFDAMIQAE